MFLDSSIHMHTSTGLLSQTLMPAMLRNLLFISSLKISVASVWPLWLFIQPFRLCLWDPSHHSGVMVHFSRWKIFPKMFYEESGPWCHMGGLCLRKCTGQKRIRWSLIRWINSTCVELSWDMLMLSRSSRGPPIPLFSVNLVQLFPK